MTKIRDTDKLALMVEKRRREIALEHAKPLELNENFPAQNAFVNDPSRFIVAQCSRRAGKSNALALKFFRTLEKYPGSQCLYLALTRESALSILWPVLHEINDKYKLGCRFVESKLTMHHPSGAILRLLGADAKNFIKRIRGIKTPAVGIDEAQDFGTHLQTLVDDVLTPAMADYKESWLALTGTAGPVPNGYFFEATEKQMYGYSIHKWTILQNPHMPDSKAFVDEIKAKRGWDDTNPTYRREWLNEWVLDTNSLWVRYNAFHNDYISMPDVKPSKYYYIMGVDIGFRDADAIAIIAWSESTKTTYLVEELITKKQDITALAEQIERLRIKYDVDKIVMDAGALGKKIHEELTKRHQIAVEAADKMRKQENVELLNDALRLGQFQAKANSRFAQDSYLVQIDWDKSTPDKIVLKKTVHSDIIDAVLYAFKVSPGYTYVKPKEKPKYGTDAYFQEQETSMFELELEGLKSEYEAKDPWYNR